MILVVSTGRAGTSEVAQILIELGVNMGKRHHAGDKFNPKGYFEDRDFQELNMMWFVLGLSEEYDTYERWNMWEDRFKKLVNARKEPWGLKDPGIADNPKLLAEYINLNSDIIYCTRNREDTIASFMRMKNTIASKAEHIYENRTKNIKRILTGNYLTVDCYDTNKKWKIKKWMGHQ